MSGCNTCGGANSSTPSGSNWVAPSNPCENTEVSEALPSVIAADAPACDSVKTVHVITGAPCENDPCGTSSATAVVNDACGEQAVNALFDVTKTDVAVPAGGGSLPILVADATRYWVGLTICIGTNASHFFAKVIARETTTNIITITRVSATGSAATGTLIASCSPIVSSVPGVGDDFCLFDDAVGADTVGDLLMFQSGDGCSPPVALASSEGLLYHNATTGAKQWVPVPADEDYYVIRRAADGGLSVVTLESALSVVRPSVIESIQYFEVSVTPGTSPSVVNLSPFVDFTKTFVVFDFDTPNDANVIVSWAWNVDGESINVTASGGAGTEAVVARLQVIEYT